MILLCYRVEWYYYVIGLSDIGIGNIVIFYWCYPCCFYGCGYVVAGQIMLLSLSSFFLWVVASGCWFLFLSALSARLFASLLSEQLERLSQGVAFSVGWLHAWLAGFVIVCMAVCLLVWLLAWCTVFADVLVRWAELTILDIFLLLASQIRF